MENLKSNISFLYTNVQTVSAFAVFMSYQLLVHTLRSVM